MVTTSSELSRIVACAIHPSIGIARVGNSQSAYFVGPEAPGWTPGVDERFKDAEGRVVKELTLDDAAIEWRVHVANRKAGWYQFQNAMDLGALAMAVGRRNADY